MIALRVERGLTLREIGVRYGISRERVRQIIGNTGRKLDRTHCIECGKEIDPRALRCVQCQGARRRKWGKAEILRRMQAWNETFGEPPRPSDWKNTAARDLWPPPGAVIAAFGTWKGALNAAGLSM